MVASCVMICRRPTEAGAALPLPPADSRLFNRWADERRRGQNKGPTPRSAPEICWLESDAAPGPHLSPIISGAERHQPARLCTDRRLASVGEGPLARRQQMSAPLALSLQAPRARRA